MELRGNSKGGFFLMPLRIFVVGKEANIAYALLLYVAAQHYSIMPPLRKEGEVAGAAVTEGLSVFAFIS